MESTLALWHDALCNDLLTPVCAKRNACYGQPCQNGATCTTVDCSTTGNYTCTCAAGFTGTNCSSKCINYHCCFPECIFILQLLQLIIGKLSILQLLCPCSF